MRKSIIKEKIIKCEHREYDGAAYTYTLLMRESNRVASYRLPLYSVEIEMTDPLGNKTEASTNDIFSDVGKALIFFKRMADNLATPLNLPYILADEMQ